MLEPTNQTHDPIAEPNKDVKFFRSHMRHSIRPNRVDGARISIAFNLTA